MEVRFFVVDRCHFWCGLTRLASVLGFHGWVWFLYISTSKWVLTSEAERGDKVSRDFCRSHDFSVNQSSSADSHRFEAIAWAPHHQPNDPIVFFRTCSPPELKQMETGTACFNLCFTRTRFKMNIQVVLFLDTYMHKSANLEDWCILFDLTEIQRSQETLHCVLNIDSVVALPKTRTPIQYKTFNY